MPSDEKPESGPSSGIMRRAMGRPSGATPSAPAEGTGDAPKTVTQRLSGALSGLFGGATDAEPEVQGPSLEELSGVETYAARVLPITTLDVRYIEDEQAQRRAVLKAVGDELVAAAKPLWDKLRQVHMNPALFANPQFTGVVGLQSVDQGVYDLEQSVSLRAAQARRKHHPQASVITVDIADWHLGEEKTGSSLSKAPSSRLYGDLEQKGLLSHVTGVLVYSGKAEIDFSNPHLIQDPVYKRLVEQMDAAGNNLYVLSLRKGPSIDADSELLAKAIIGAQFMVHLGYVVAANIVKQAQPSDATPAMRQALYAAEGRTPVEHLAQIGPRRFLVDQVRKAGSSVERFVQGGNGALGYDNLVRVEYGKLLEGVRKFYQKELAQ